MGTVRPGSTLALGFRAHPIPPRPEPLVTGLARMVARGLNLDVVQLGEGGFLQCVNDPPELAHGREEPVQHRQRGGWWRTPTDRRRAVLVQAPPCDASASRPTGHAPDRIGVARRRQVLRNSSPVRRDASGSKVRPVGLACHPVPYSDLEAVSQQSDAGDLRRLFSDKVLQRRTGGPLGARECLGAKLRLPLPLVGEEGEQVPRRVRFDQGNPLWRARLAPAWRSGRGR